MNKYFSNEKIAYEVYTNKEVIYCRTNGCFSLFPVCSIPSIGYMPPQELKEKDYCFTYWKIFPLKERWTEKEAVIFCKNKVRMQMESKKAQLLRMFLTREKVITKSIEKEIINSNKRSATADNDNHELAEKIARNMIDKVLLTKDGRIPLKKGDYICFYDTKVEKIRMGFITTLGDGLLKVITKDNMPFDNSGTSIIGIYRGDEVGFERAYDVIRAYCATNREGNILSDSEKPGVCYLSGNAWFYFSKDLSDFCFTFQK